MNTLIIASMLLAASAQDLPQTAQATIAQNFTAEVSFVDIDREGNRIEEYEVELTDGTDITFDAKGNWKEIEGSVPASLLPKALVDYVKTKYPKSLITAVEKGHKGYEIELSNDLDLKFDKKGKFLRVDD